MHVVIEQSVLRTKSPFFIIAKNFFIFGLLWILSSFLYGVFDYESYFSIFIYLTSSYATYFFGYLIFKPVVTDLDDNSVKRVENLSLILLVLYYTIVPLRSFLVEIHHDLYGLRLMFGFIYPIWILTPIFITNPKNKFYIYLCVLVCALEVIFWILFFKMTGSKFYKDPLSVSMFAGVLIFALTFPLYLSWLKKIDINKWILPFFFKEDRFISKLISWVVIGLGSLFMFLFYLFF
ncbi:MAG: hypothetical protein OC189_17335 [Acinetobacter sp.]|uniref:hypothetical protein n=1 Tax=Acinetobacter sp. TaxID=472 RepID=UPI00258386F3|nr:hypothetical protein [Acinetobacter sp.]MDK4793767.1 hypothetical protein [Acinetobacter sp.]